MEDVPDRFAFSSTSGCPGGWQLCPDDQLGLGVLLQHLRGSRWMQLCPDDPLCTFQIRGPSPADPFLQNCPNYREKQEKTKKVN